MYFKQSLMDSDEQWSQHKKIIETTKRGLRRCVRGVLSNVAREFQSFHLVSHKCYKTITATIESLSNTDARSQEQLTRTSAQVPKGFAYFHVRWSDGQGFAHIIENRAKFGKTFGLDVITGMLGLDVMNRRRGNCVTDEDIKNFTQRWNTVSDGM